MVQFPAAHDVAFAALSDATRRGVLERLSRKDASITELADTFGMTLTGMKKHVRVLENAGLVATRKEAQAVFYRLADPKAARVLALLRDLYCPSAR